MLTELETAWASEPIGRFKKDKNLLSLSRLKTLDLPALSGVTIGTTIPWLTTNNQFNELGLLSHGINADNTYDVETASVVNYIETFELTL